MKTEIEEYEACKDAVEYREQFNTFQEAWKNCQRGDWMLWIAFKLKVNKRTLTLTKARCAKTVMHLMEDERSIKAVKVAEKYGLGYATEEELEEASNDASYASYTSYASAAASNAAYCASYSSAAAAAAYYTSKTAYYAADAILLSTKSIEAKKQNELETADICREILTAEVFEKLNIK